MICAGCSTTPDPAPPPPPRPYAGLPAGLLERCTADDIPLQTTGDITRSRNIYKSAFTVCAARVDAIREHDAKARQIQ